MARKPDEITDPQDLANYYLATAEFPSGFMTQYTPSAITAGNAQQDLATGFPLGRRFKSSEVVLVADGNAKHLGHHARADGRWRIYAFADRPAAGEASALTDFATWIASDASPLTRFTPADADPDAVFDLKVIYQQGWDEVEINRVPDVFRPKVGRYGLTDWERVYAAAPNAWTSTDIFEERGLSRDGVIVVVRPDQYVAHILPLTAHEDLADFFAGFMLPAR